FWGRRFCAAAWKSRYRGQSPALYANYADYWSCSMHPSKKVMIVTGGSRGIGAAVARLASRRGYAVCVNYHRRRDAADGVVRAIQADGGHAIAMGADVSD